MYIKLTCGGICNDDPQKIRWIFFSIFKVGHQVRQKYGFLIKHAHWFLFVCCFFPVTKNWVWVCFFREKQMLHKHCFVHTIYLVKEKMQTHDTRDETLRRKSSGGITDGLNWLKRHHNFSFFFHQIFLYIFLHIFFFCYVFASKCCVVAWFVC